MNTSVASDGDEAWSVPSIESTRIHKTEQCRYVAVVSEMHRTIRDFGDDAKSPQTAQRRAERLGRLFSGQRQNLHVSVHSRQAGCMIRATATRPCLDDDDDDDDVIAGTHVALGRDEPQAGDGRGNDTWGSVSEPGWH